MGKDKKKHSKKDKSSEDVLDMAALTLKKFRKVTKQISKLSTGQKVVGGIALAAAGLTYLATRDAESALAESSNDEDAPAHNDDTEPKFLRKGRKSLRAADE